MGGIIFFKTQNFEHIKDFYISRLGMTVWLEQTDCVILKHGNLLLGFCERDESEIAGMITFFYENKEDVDRMYQQLEERALGEPKVNDKYHIYQFLAEDPESRLLEFQAFLHPVEAYQMGDNLLSTRRSIREFEERMVPEEILWKIFELCRYAPTARNRQPYYFVSIRDRDKLEFLAGLREGSSAPIARAPMAVAICADPTISKRYVQDGCIAAYHFILAAKLFGLGTCWIGGMDQEDAKEVLDIPQEHHIATITPLGYPAEQPETPPKKAAKDLVRFI